ncbi:phosphoribosylformylglycinamidine synthase subunit PurL [Sneathiella sp.]|mgnify:CR=1 FL=1|uniref:phosphoribosylformylglycinamidine synthase subunit PurL n=1 Tax=Sneathiella sp. TaxID=1964365 RepID=UPI002FE2744A
MTEITREIVAEHGLSDGEYEELLKVLGRTPNLTELGIFSVMWSEHCSYKSSKKWLKTLPTEAPWVICGPGENAGIIDIGDGQAAVFKMESHNHPSYIEPYQGAATGVGGIMRDVFTMGARPIANMNALRFGRPDHPKTRHLVAGVVAGISGYGNCMGVPTVGGETNFHSSYDNNILVNAMTVGLVDADKIFYSAAGGIGNPVVYVGSKTGRDGIHGATMASAEFDDDSDEKRPTVQVGDPFTEKLLLEACLELMATDAIVAIQDMGAAGLTSSSFEMADKGGVGIELNLDQVPMREEGMTPYEIMLSESQERMLMILKPGREEEARRIFEKWELDFAVIGKVTDTGRMILTMHDEVVADLPVAPLADAAPEYDRPWVKTPPQAKISADDVPSPNDLGEVLLKLMGSSEIASRKWIWEQYDHMVMGDTLQRPGGDAAVVRVHGTKKALAITTDCTPRYCYADPETGGAQAVAEAWRNITATGALPLAITDCMNFGNPQRPEIMGQFVGCIEGMKNACLALDFPVISGNVSLYNETNGVGIHPTPAVGGVGILKDYSVMTTVAFKSAGDVVLLLGDLTGEMGQSLYLREIEGREEGAPPVVDLARERKHGDYLRSMIEKRLVTAAHDLSDGGLGVALAEMAIAGDLGADLNIPTDLPPHAALFGESQAAYVLTAKPGDVERLRAFAAEQDIPLHILGTIGHTDLKIGDWLTISVAKLRKVHAEWLPALMAEPGS